MLSLVKPGFAKQSGVLRVVQRHRIVTRDILLRNETAKR